MKRLICYFLALLISFGLSAQDGEIAGRVTDDKGEGVPYASVTVDVNGTIHGALTDFDGYYNIKPVPAGKHTVKVSFLGMADYQANGVIVTPDRMTSLDVKMSPDAEIMDEVIIVDYKVPLIRKDETTTGGITTKEDIKNLSTRNVTSIASTTAAVFQADEGGGLNVKGAKSNATDMYIDGMKVRGNTNIPASALSQVEMITGGVPPRYGDATGGIVSVTTSSPAKSFDGQVELETSQFLDAFGHNLAALNLSGPLLKTKKDEKGYQRSLLGFFVVGQYLNQKDDDPSAVGIYKLKDEVYDEIVANPLISSTTGTGLLQNVELQNESSFEKIGARKNMRKEEISTLGNIIFSPTDKISVTLGGQYIDRDGGASQWTSVINRYYAFGWNHLPNYSTKDLRGYLRFSQRFDSDLTEEEIKERKGSVLSNANYSIQLDMSKSFEKSQDPVHKDNFFDYGYIGKFDQERVEQYNQQTIDLLNGEGMPVTLNGRVFSGYQSSGVNYTPGSVNSQGVAYNNQFFNLIGENLPTDIQSIPGVNGLINGSQFLTSYGLFYTPIVTYDFFDKKENDQYRLSFNGSVDVKPKGKSDKSRHSFMLGLEYEQRVDRDWNLTPEELWNEMRRNIARIGPSGEIQLDTSNPILVFNGQEVPLSEYNPAVHGAFTSYDTITYNLIRTTTNNNGTIEYLGSDFDLNFRDRFGLGLTDYVNIDTYTPDQLSLDLFSADDLFVGGNNIVDYYGYDYLGNKLTKQPGFDEFWTATNERGQKTRPIAAFRPNYVAGYIQDKFAFKDLVFRVGARVDRFDANTKVLKDEYSLYGVRTASEVAQMNGQNISHPATIGDDFVVYVDDASNPQEIKGYRDGDTWYNANGAQITDPEIIGVEGIPTPYLSNPLDSKPADDIKDTNFDPTTAFEDYKPQINVMPRIAFSFPISDKAQFFAHYDVLTQRPQGRQVATPLDYYFLSDNATLVFNNPNLKPEKTVDYQLGFKQVVSNSSSIEFTAFYKELRDMVQIMNVNFAYPTTYTTYGNRDFGTVKGISLSYDLRRTGNVRLNASYTLQFADGTGSGTTSSSELISSGQPNLLSVFPLDYDQRHTLVLSFDYRYGSGSDYNGPMWFGTQFFSNAGANLILRAGSGTPYSATSNITTQANNIGLQQAGTTPLEGSVNGSRLPWQFRMDLKIDKDFALKAGKEGKHGLALNVYIQIQNLLNTENIISVYRATGSPSDDGYLTYPGAQGYINATTDPQAFRDLYNVKVNNPNNYSLPRRARLGIELQF